MGGRGETRAFDIYTDKALSTGEAGRFWNGVSSSSYISEHRQALPSQRKNKSTRGKRQEGTPCSFMGY